MTHRARILAAVGISGALLVGCGVSLPPGAYYEWNGCINLDATPDYPRLNYHGPNNTWYFDGVPFGYSAAEDGCVRPRSV